MSTKHTPGPSALYRVEVQDTKGQWHKAHARPFKSHASAMREMQRHTYARMVAKYPGAINWLEIGSRADPNAAAITKATGSTV